MKFGSGRVVLLIEIERYCAQIGCSHRNRVALTKSEARDYNGFVCERCERRNPDVLQERDVPEWWKEIMVSGER